MLCQCGGWRFALLLLALVVALGLVAGCGGEATRGIISGKVLVPHETTASDAVVTLSGTDYRALVNVSGDFRFARLPAGTYTVLVRKPGWTVDQKSGIAVAEGEAVDAGLFTLVTTAAGVLAALRVKDADGDEVWVSTDSPATDVQMRGFVSRPGWWIGGKVVRDATKQYGFYFDPSSTVMAEVTAEGMQTTISQIAAKPDDFAGGTWYISGEFREYLSQAK